MRILFVAMADSIHIARWINQIADQGWDIQLFPVYSAARSPELRNVTVYGQARVHAKVVSNPCSSRRPRRRLQGKSCAEDSARSNLPDMLCVHTLALFRPRNLHANVQYIGLLPIGRAHKGRFFENGRFAPRKPPIFEAEITPKSRESKIPTPERSVGL